MFVNIVCSYWLFPYFGMKHPEISEEVRHDILFPGRHDILFAMLCNYLDQSDDAYYRIIIFRYNSVFFYVLQCWYSNRNNICCSRSFHCYCDHYYGCTKQETQEENKIKDWYVFNFYIFETLI